MHATISVIQLKSTSKCNHFGNKIAQVIKDVLVHSLFVSSVIKWSAYQNHVPNAVLQLACSSATVSLFFSFFVAAVSLLFSILRKRVLAAAFNPEESHSN